MMIHLQRIIISVCIFAFIVDEYLTQNLWDETELRSVTSFSVDQAVAHYMSFSELKTPTNPKDKNVKKNICREIFGSHYFRAYAENWVYLDPEDVREELRNNFSAIFERIFTRKVSSSGDEYYEYENNYRQLTVSLIAGTGIIFSEHAFVCLTRNQQSDEIKEYFVSQEYNVNEVENASPIAGRFIFSYEFGGNSLFLEALAEESAKTSQFLRRSYLLEAFYMMVRRDYIPARRVQMDPICGLSDDDKVRLCSSLFSAREFNQEVTFEPRVDNGGHRCEKKEVLISSWIGRLVRHFFMSGRRPFEEWVMNCIALNDRDEEIIYKVSRGPDMNSIFVFISSGADVNRISVYDIASNVSVANIRNRVVQQELRFLGNDVEN